MKRRMFQQPPSVYTRFNQAPAPTMGVAPQMMMPRQVMVPPQLTMPREFASPISTQGIAPLFNFQLFGKPQQGR